MKCEIEFLPVGAASKPGDAIVVRYGEPHAYEVMIVDGGTLESGQQLVEHIGAHFGNVIISHVVLTHSDADHASGLRPVLEQLPVRNFWLHVPWLHAGASRPYFQDKTKSEADLAKAIRKEYDIIDELIQLAQKQKCWIGEPFAGTQIGPFTVLSPPQLAYELLLPQFDKTPAPDQVAIEAQGFWIAKQTPRGALGGLFERALAKAQKWIPESWESERLRDGGVTSASNETSVVLYGSFEQGRVLLTADAGVWALTMAAARAEQTQLPLRQFSFVQVPHHGSRRNVGPTILNRMVGAIVPRGSAPHFHAFVSAPPEDDSHPRKMALNAFMRRGGRLAITRGTKQLYYGGFPIRQGYRDPDLVTFSNQVEEYD